LIEIKNFGQKSAEEVIDALQKRLGINLPKERTVKSIQ
jgi:DNA-directed RNA polymerase subunit alpha